MVISHNMMAMNAYRQNNIVNKSKGKTVEKLSSGYRINRAADDAAGLAISEKMRRQIRGLNQGAANTQDGISFLQVADGATNEVHDILNRLEELSVKAANGSNTPEDRSYIDAEAQQLIKEMTRIDSTTTFNEKKVFFDQRIVENKEAKPTAESKFFKLLDGNVTTSGYMQEPILKDDLKAMNYTTAHHIDMDTTKQYTGVHIDFGPLINGKNGIDQLAGTQFYVNCCTNCCPAVVQFTDDNHMGVSKDVPSPAVERVFNIGVKKADGTYYTNAAEFNNAIVNAFKPYGESNHVEFAANGSKLLLYDVDPNAWSESDKQLAYFCDTSNFYNPGTLVTSPIWIQMGAEPEQGMYISTGRVDGVSLGIDPLSLKTKEDAEATIDKVKNAAGIVSRIRSKVGAQQNRLEHGYDANLNTVENTSAAESAIRDADMAKEMVTFSLKNILEQAGQSMLSQANQSAQGVMSLLQ